MGKKEKSTPITIETIIDELEEARQIALSGKPASAAISATMGKAKLLGLVCNKVETDEMSEPKEAVVKFI